MDTQTRQILHASARHFKADAAQFRDGRLWLLNGYCGNGTGEKTPGWSVTVHSEADARKFAPHCTVTIAEELAAIEARRKALPIDDIGGYLYGVLIAFAGIGCEKPMTVRRAVLDALEIAMDCAEAGARYQAKRAEVQAIADASRGSD